MGNSAGPTRITPLPTLLLDAANKQSYPGTGTTWYDITDRRNRYQFSPPGTSPTFNSSNGGNFQFNGSGYYRFNSLLLLGTTGQSSSASIWFKSSDNTKDLQYIFSLNGGWGILSRSGVLNYTIGGSTSALPYSIVENQWYHLTMTVQGPLSTSSVSVYVNGQPIVSNSGSRNAGSNSLFQLGGNLFSNNLFGNIGHFAFNRLTVLNEKQVYNNYITTRGRFGV